MLNKGTESSQDLTSLIMPLALWVWCAPFVDFSRGSWEEITEKVDLVHHDMAKIITHIIL